MMRNTPQQGVTLIELLVVIAILGMILGGIYGLMDSANKMFLRTRAISESQQTSRVVINYLAYRLRQLEGSGLVANPRDCRNCHFDDQDADSSTDDPDIPCWRDVLIPRKTVFLEALSTIPLPPLSGALGTDYQNISGGNYIQFWGDLLPQNSLADTFTDSPRYKADGTTPHPYYNGKWDLSVDNDGDGHYDPGDDRELLYFDMNDNGAYDFYAEKWTLQLKKSDDGNYYDLVESLTFDHTDSSGTVFENYSGKNRSTYSPYTEIPIASGIVALGIKKIQRILAPASYSAKGHKLRETSCGGTYNPAATVVDREEGPGNRDGCHGISAKLPKPGTPASSWPAAAWLNVYDNETSFNYERFIATHPTWNIKGFVVDLVTVDPTGSNVLRTQQFITPRNIEVNQERVETFY